MRTDKRHFPRNSFNGVFHLEELEGVQFPAAVYDGLKVEDRLLVGVKLRDFDLRIVNIFLCGFKQALQRLVRFLDIIKERFQLCLLGRDGIRDLVDYASRRLYG